MKYILILGLLIATMANAYTIVCVKGVSYLFTDNGVTVMYNQSGKILTCQGDNND